MHYHNSAASSLLSSYLSLYTCETRVKPAPAPVPTCTRTRTCERHPGQVQPSVIQVQNPRAGRGSNPGAPMSRLTLGIPWHRIKTRKIRRQGKQQHCPHFVRAFLAPYLLLAVALSTTAPRSSAPLTTLYRTPGKSCVRPPRMRTTLCSCNVCPSPGIYAHTVLPVESFTRATLRFPEFGFLGDRVVIEVQTPFRWYAPSSAGDFAGLVFLNGFRRMLWFMVTVRTNDGNVIDEEKRERTFGLGAAIVLVKSRS